VYQGFMGLTLCSQSRNKAMMNKSLLYVRVSSKEQEKEGFSLDAQEKLGLDYARRRGLEIVKTWKVSESAWREERSSFNQMVEYAKKHSEVRHIIFDVTDRMTRNDFDKIKIIDLIKMHGKTIHFSRSNKTIDKNSGSEDVFMLDIEVAVAKKMSNDISRKTKMGLQEKAEQGIYPSAAPMGYKNNPVTGAIDLDPVRAPFIARMFELYATGICSTPMLTKMINSEGFRNKRGNPSGDAAIYSFLTNPFYYGVFRWQGRIFKGSHEPLVSKEIFDRVQALLHRRQQAPQKPEVTVFYLNNLMTCGVCGCKVLGERKKARYTYYHCTFSKGKQEHGNKTFVREEAITNMLGEIVGSVTLKDEDAVWIMNALQEDTQYSRDRQEARLHALKTEYGKVSQRLSRLYDAKFDGTIPEDVFRAKEKEYQNELISLKARMEEFTQENQKYLEDAKTTLELCKQLKSLYDAGSLEEKADLAKIVASNYSLTDGTLYPQMRKPFDLVAKGLSSSEWLPRLGSNQGQAH
jgi:site-specific DNA recombinase